MKKLFYPALLLFIGFILLNSCEKEVPPVNNSGDLSELSIPESFSWSNELKSDILVSINNLAGIPIENRVLILQDYMGKEISKAVIRNNQASFNVSVPQHLGGLRLYFPASQDIQEIFSVSESQQIVFNIGNQLPKSLKTEYDSPDCSSGCDRTISGSVSEIVIEKKEIVCLTGELNGKIVFKGQGTIKICGVAKISNIEYWSNNSSNIIITESGNVTASSIPLYGNNFILKNYSSSFILNDVLNVGGKVYNYGEMSVKGVESYGDSEVFNYGVLRVNGLYSNSANLFNMESGSMLISGAFHNNHKAYNECKIIADGLVGIWGKLENYGYIRSKSNFEIYTGSQVALFDGSMLSTVDFEAGTKIECPEGESAGIKISGHSLLTQQADIRGHIDICDEGGEIDQNYGKLGEEVTFCELFIEQNQCNPEGMGVAAGNDSDGDGILDDEDDFPDDPTKAFISYEPYTGERLIAFEDLWPSLGDYDFNDLVITTRITYHQNASLVPVSANVRVILHARGAGGVLSGLAMHFYGEGLNQEAISSVTGNGVYSEENVNNSIVIADDVLDMMSEYYANNGQGPSKTPDTLNFSIDFNTANMPVLSSLEADFFYL